jgi:GDP-L-fucose synthase
MRKILITGGSGLVGSAFKNIANEFAEQYEFIFLSSSDCNLEKLDETMACFTRINPHYIIHLAACVGGLYKNMNYKVNMLEKNLLMNFNVIKCSYEVKVEKLHRLKRKMRQNAVMIYIFYNYVSNNLLDVPL